MDEGVFEELKASIIKGLESLDDATVAPNIKEKLVQ